MKKNFKFVDRKAAAVMKSKGKLYRNLFIIGLVFLIMTSVVYRYLPFRKILRVTASKEMSFIGAAKTGSEPPNSIAFDFEVAPGKEIPNGIITGNAHSGKYAAKAFGKNAFTPALERTAAELGVNKLKYISVSAWVFVKPGGGDVTAALVLAASNNMGVNICWKGVGLKDPLVPRGKWFKMSGQFDLSDVKFGNDTRVQLYFWNNSSTDILVDDYFMVYGGPQPRRGDTTYVDLTKGPYQAKFNYPPFPVRFLRMAEIVGMQDASLTGGAGDQKGVVLPSDAIVSGNFFAGNAGRDVLFVIPKEGNPGIYAYCPESNSFRRSAVEGTKALLSSAPGKQYLLKGKFIIGETEQLLYTDEKSCMLCKFSSKGGTCRDGNNAVAEILWQSEKFDNLSFDPEKPLLADDFDGDGISELLAVDLRGAWKLYRFQTGKSGGIWAVIAEGKEEMPGWQPSAGTIRFTSGHFIPGRPQDELLAVAENGRDGKCSYTLKVYDPSGKRFVSCFPGKYGLFQKIFGLDTLKPADRFYCGSFGPNGSPMVLRYNRDWRYDLKEISFSDSTYHILNNIDFAGYSADHNPKYYEVLKLIPGRFTGNQCSFIVIGRNCKNKDYDGMECSEYEDLPGLPGFISLYSFVN